MTVTEIKAIEAINRGEAPDFSAYSNNCTTEVQDVLKDFGLSFGDRLPSTYWSDVYHKYSEDVKENPFKLLFTAPHEFGKDYGNPRNVGMKWSDLLSLLWLQQLRHADEEKINEPKACVTAGGETTCDR